MKENTRVLILHSGFSWYLPFVVNQAIKTNAGGETIFVCSRRDQGSISCSSTVFMEDLESSNSKMFARVYQHISTDTHFYALLCWLRFFYALELMERRGLDSIFMMDSDVLLYSSMKSIAESYADIDMVCGVSIPEDCAGSLLAGVSSHSGYWSIEALRCFCEFAIELYSSSSLLEKLKQMWQDHLEHGPNLPGGVSDMTGLYLFWRENLVSVYNLARSHNGSVFDHNIGIGLNAREGEYEIIKSGMKKIVFKNGLPHFVTSGTKELIKAHSLHFQGPWKFKIPTHYRAGYFPEIIPCGLAWARTMIRRKLLPIELS